MITSLSYRLFLSFFLLSPLLCMAQLNLTSGEKYLENESFKQIFVSVEDHTVWALNNSGTVFYKPDTEAAFKPYLPTNGLVINEITGFNESEMYFLIKPNVIVHFKGGVKHEIKIEEPGVTRVNNISVINTKRNIDYEPANAYNPANDYLAVATNKHAYKIFRGNLTITNQFIYPNQPLVNEPDWRITNAGYKSVDFQYIYTMARCFVNDHAAVNYQAYTTYVSAIPDRAPYPSKINCTLFAHHWQFGLPAGSGWQIWYSLWGTDEGLYAYNNVSCTGLEIKKLIENEKINDLEEVYALTPVFKQNFAFAATDRGLYYTPASIFNELTSSPERLDRLKFIKFPASNNIKINSVCVDTDIKILKEANYNYWRETMCEKVLWVAKDQGISKIYLSLDQDYYQNLKYTDFIYSKTPSNGYNQDEVIFETCGNQSINVKTRVPVSLQNQLLFQWFKDDVEISEWIGKASADLKESGKYTFKVTALCENLTLTSLPIIIKNNTTPEITFNYPAEINLCSGQTYLLETKRIEDYKYQWIKNGTDIPNATQNTYNATLPGIYEVKVSNCENYYELSKQVKINQIVIPTVQLTTAKTAYCIGETTEIKVDNPNNYLVKWYRNGLELPEFKNQNIISIALTGAYTASLTNDNGCANTSVATNISFNAIPDVTISRSSDKILCSGEEVILTAVTNQAGTDFFWSTGETTKTIKINKSGIYSVSFTSTSGCKRESETVEVNVNEPLLLFQPEQLRICVIAKEKVTLEAPAGFAFYIWEGQKTSSPFYQVNKPGYYSLTVEDIYGCTKSVNYSVIQYCKDILIPTAFSPNDDNVNDLWQVSGLESDPQSSIQIFNQYGNIIHTTTGKAPFWDGKVKGNPANVGVYYYLIKSKNTSQALTGTITLIR
ncbi:gliding motility-associated C-terminal domain-containing protein [Pedobacter jeongneungensis]